eukprot:RCo042224
MHSELGYSVKEFTDGRYGGVLLLSVDGAPVHHREIELALRFRDKAITGTATAQPPATGGGGAPTTGPVTGSYNDKPPYDFEVSVPALQLQLNGARNDGNILTGRWKSRTDESQKGLFELNMAEEEESPEKDVQSLVGMGFDAVTAGVAINTHHMSVSEAVEWMSQGCPPVAGGAQGAGGEGGEEDNIRQICEMGFDVEQAKEALKATQNNVSAAINMLCGE